MNKPLKDLVIVELASVLAGPAVGLFFAELGARVIKIENPTTGGDVTRQWKHPLEPQENSHSAYYYSINWGKETVFLNAKESEDYQTICDYISKADIVISNFRSTSAKKLKLDYTSLKAQFPDLIYGSITAYGLDSDKPGFDALLQAETGWMHLNGSADGPPTKMPVALIDVLAAHQLKEGLLIALIHKMKTNKGSHVTISLFDAAVSALTNQASNHLNLGINPIRKGSQHPNIAPYGDIITTQDGVSFLLAIGNDKQFSDLCQILNLSELTAEADFATNTSRVVNRDTLVRKLQAKSSLLSSQQFSEACEQRSVPVGRIRDLASLFKNPLSQSMILSAEEADGSKSHRVSTAAFRITTA